MATNTFPVLSIWRSDCLRSSPRWRQNCIRSLPTWRRHRVTPSPRWLARRFPPFPPPSLWRPEAASGHFRLPPAFTRSPHEMAAAESFLAFNPAARPGPAAASRRRARGPRNRKKGWKRWSGPEAQLGREIGDFLEDVGLQERAFPLRDPPTFGGLISGVVSPSDPSPFCSICAHQTPNGRKEKRRQEFWEKKAEKGIFPRGERRLRARLSRGGAPTPQKPPELGRSDPQRSFYDIWGEHNPLDAPLAGQDPWYLQQTKKMRVQRPARLQAKPSPLPPVEVIGQGGSYNPPFQEHQVWGPGGSQEGLGGLRGHLGDTGGDVGGPREVWEAFKEVWGGPGEVWETQKGLRDPGGIWGVPEGGRQDSGPGCDGMAAPQAAGRARSRLASQRLQGLFRLRSLRRALLQRDSELRRRRLLRERRRLQRETAPRRLGRLRAPRKPQESLKIKLGNIPKFQPEGNVLRDRFKSLQRRNMIEPRERAKFKRRYRVKYVEKRAFREVT
uniref:Ribosome biogenesis protein NOP53 n=1 Tax=Corvus moneduloides TaxID=1196302 RepID=A0A8U7N507_CORMO